MVIIPNLTFTIDSQVSSAIRNFTGQIRSAYDNAIFSGRIQRMVIDIKDDSYWVEQAPLGFEGRPPHIDLESEADLLVKKEKRNEIIKYLNEKAKNGSDRQMLTSGKNYSPRSIPVVQRKVLNSIEWREVNDSVTYKQKLPNNIVFAQIISGISNKTYNYKDISLISNKNTKTFVYIYFLPNGTTSPTSIQIASSNNKEKGIIDEEGPKYTLNLNTFTGECYLLEGFQNANFALPKK